MELSLPVGIAAGLAVLTIVHLLWSQLDRRRAVAGLRREWAQPLPRTRDLDCWRSRQSDHLRSVNTDQGRRRILSAKATYLAGWPASPWSPPGKQNPTFLVRRRRATTLDGDASTHEDVAERMRTDNCIFIGSPKQPRHRVRVGHSLESAAADRDRIESFEGAIYLPVAGRYATREHVWQAAPIRGAGGYSNERARSQEQREPLRRRSGLAFPERIRPVSRKGSGRRHPCGLQ